MRKADYALSREKTHWNARVREVWDRVRFVEAGPGPSGSLISGTAVAVRAAIDLAGLAPDDVRVEVVVGRVDSNGHLEETEVIVLPFRRAAGYGRGVRQRYHSRANRPAGLRTARQPESLRRSAHPAVRQSC